MWPERSPKDGAVEDGARGLQWTSRGPVPEQPAVWGLSCGGHPDTPISHQTPPWSLEVITEEQGGGGASRPHKPQQGPDPLALSFGAPKVGGCHSCRGLNAILASARLPVLRTVLERSIVMQVGPRCQSTAWGAGAQSPRETSAPQNARGRRRGSNDYPWDSGMVALPSPPRRFPSLLWFRGRLGPAGHRAAVLPLLL